MIGRLLCWLGFHEWEPYTYFWSFNGCIAYTEHHAKRCLRCSADASDRPARSPRAPRRRRRQRWRRGWGVTPRRRSY